MRATDQYHLGFTMRFPRALSIREDLSVADCVTASGIIRLYGFRAFFSHKHGSYLGNRSF